ncbi:unnamed protein product [Angiostrongylus costaricensis]|uniref:Uncharacterized protein n=1 Tax=Angiostrongylus costaricensis TaxID=334426 RepID=A0A0R3PV60_ANGCS|nr:unnamed protein product [Angiostrongylus costaricensis]
MGCDGAKLGPNSNSERAFSGIVMPPITVILDFDCVIAGEFFVFFDPSPCARNASSSPRQRPQVLAVLTEARCQQKIRSRNRSVTRDPIRRHTLSDVDVLKKFARWFGIRKSSPDVSAQHSLGEEENLLRKPLPCFDPPVIVRTSPNELTPASGDELL